MVVDHAERLDWRSCHQLSRRVGRGAAKKLLHSDDWRKSFGQARTAGCDGANADGFELAELDLACGSGRILCTRQAGLPGFRVAIWCGIATCLELAKQEASRFASAPDDSVTEAERKRAGITCPGLAAPLWLMERG